jgi:hypothetical protein
VGSQTPLQQIHGEYADIKARNDGQQGRVEDILSQRLAAEAHTKQVWPLVLCSSTSATPHNTVARALMPHSLAASGRGANCRHPGHYRPAPEQHAACSTPGVR